MRSKLWTEQENEFLIGQIGSRPRALLIAEHKRLAHEGREGFIKRTRYGIKDHIDVLLREQGLSARPVHNYWTIAELSRILDVSTCRVNTWIPHGLRTIKATYHHSITRKAFENWVKSGDNASRVSDLERDRLFYVLENWKTVDWVLSHNPKTPKKRPIRCIETGKVYAHMGEVAIAYNRKRTTISRAVRLGRECAGVHFEKVL